MRKVFPITALLVCGVFSRGDAQTHAGAPYGYDPSGRPVYQLASSREQRVVLLFLATDCPISNRYVPEIQRLENEFAGKQVVFWLVYPNVNETADGVLRHEAAYGLKGATLVHTSSRLTALVRPTITPEAAVLVSGAAQMDVFRTVYLGRIDDRYVDIGKERPQATRHDLEYAIRAVLDDRPVAPPGGPPVGCGIVTEAALGKR